MNINHYLKSLEQAFVATILVLALVSATFFVAEPRVGQAVDDTFTIKQTITSEISLAAVADVVATGTINGVTGGTSSGTTTAVVTTNNFGGYTMTIAFADADLDGESMLGDVSGSDAIKDYPAGAQPTYNFDTANPYAVFAYTVANYNSTYLDDSFKDNGSNACNSGSGFQGDKCWMEPSTSSFQIINHTVAANTGATTTINFRVHVPNAPSPAVVTDVYTATATLTALNI